MTETRKRAPGMTPDQRRDMIVRAALPLVAELGAAVTTGKIARAAGIGEATVFRVFADKDELLRACLTQAFDPEHVLAEIADIPLGQPLADRLTEAAESMRAYMERMGALIGAIGATRRPAPDDDRPHPGADRDAAMARTVEALAGLFEPERDSLRLTPEEAAELFLRLTFTRPAPEGVHALDLPRTIDAFLNGAVERGSA
ncbi:TetR/AcrR family transcriptional regulator [Phytomonospora sp. NPDC050363]|uniref:TetR/AcrR family transcriptional regulator n=1 Tax=Phytomonospora sp. NPDC050363 TaxID=3155642 RepID=UPI0033D2B48B